MNSESSFNDNSINSRNEWFTTRESAPFIDKSHKNKLFRTFDAAVTNEECKNQMIRQNEVVILIQDEFGPGEINLIHHCQEIGDRLWMQDAYFGAI